MAVRRFRSKTQQDYIRHLAMFAKFLGRSPDTATAEDVRRFQVDMTENGARPSTADCGHHSNGFPDIVLMIADSWR